MLFIAPVFFVVPIYTLTKIGNNIGKSIEVLIAFPPTFAVVLLAATPAKPHEVLGSTATYVHPGRFPNATDIIQISGRSCCRFCKPGEILGRRLLKPYVQTGFSPVYLVTQGVLAGG